MRERVVADISSAEGFYLGDICYVLAEDLYQDVWGDQNGFDDGAFQDPETGLRVAVAGTAYGDGEYPGSDGTSFPVDAGVIGLVPLELAKKEGGLEDGKVFRTPGTACFEAEDGKFRVTLPNGEEYTVDTDPENENYDDDEEDDYYG